MRDPIPHRFNDTVTLVTGGSSGLGRAITEELLKEGGQVFFSCLEADREEAEQVVATYGSNAAFLTGDMADDVFRIRLVEAAVERFGKVNNLVNNAFSFLAASLDASAEDWRRSLEVGPVAFARMAALCATEMEKQGGGAIVNISSISADIAQPHRWTYNAGKGAVKNLTRCMAMDLAELGIRANSVSPGWFWTRETLKAAGNDRDTYGPLWGKYHLLRRMGEPYECAGPVLFLLSPDASFITGTNLPVDGGYNAMGPEGLGETTRIAGTKT